MSNFLIAISVSIGFACLSVGLAIYALYKSSRAMRNLRLATQHLAEPEGAQGD